MFIVRLALALGWSIADVRRRISSRELVMWRIADQIHPIGDDRADLRAGQLGNLILYSSGYNTVKLNKYVLRGKPPSKARAEKQRRGSVGMQIAEDLGLKVHPHG